MRCAHGHRINHENLQKKKEDAVQFCTAKDDTVYVITRLAQTNFGAYGWAKWAEKDIWFKLSLLRDILQGLKTLHDAGYMHRNISERNLLIVSEKPPVALLGDFGQSINAQTSIEEPIGPTHIRAPEIGGTAYNDKIDIWNLGFVALSMFFPMAYDIVSSGGGVQEDIWYEQMDRELRNLMIQGETEAMIARLLRGMLEHDPHKRPSAALALTYLPDFTWEGMTKQESPKIVEATTESATKRKAAALLLDGPLRKLQKRTNDFENAGADPGVDNGESVDSDDYYSDDESQYDEAFKALRRLPPDGDLRDLLIALPAGIVLPDFMARCDNRTLHVLSIWFDKGKRATPVFLFRFLATVDICQSLENASGWRKRVIAMPRTRLHTLRMLKLSIPVLAPKSLRVKKASELQSH